MKKVIFDAGHGGHDCGAVGLGGLRESDVTLQIAWLCATLALNAGWSIALTRSSDIFVGLHERADKANLSRCDAFVSIHCNAAANRSASGFEVWTTRGQTAADPLAESVLRQMGRAFPGEIARLDKTDGDGDKESGFAVLRETNAPAVLVEVGFISHPETEERMRSPEWIATAARAIVDALNAWQEARP